MVAEVFYAGRVDEETSIGVRGTVIINMNSIVIAGRKLNRGVFGKSLLNDTFNNRLI